MGSPGALTSAPVLFNSLSFLSLSSQVPFTEKCGRRVLTIALCERAVTPKTLENEMTFPNLLQEQGCE